RCDSIMTVDLSRFPKLKILTVLACAFFRDLESGARIKTSPPVLALEDVCVESPKFSGDLRPLSYAPQLKYLDISSCANSIDLSQLLNASKWNGSLINLRFSNCKGTIDLIALKNFKRLERLSFNRCPHVTQAMIDDIKKDCPNLTVSYNPAKGF
ncbi:MAG: hypothetical protein K2X98_02215, partial [Alphaproteobacteria bacterium]|nr:hypothetical protein [Alphaproteobacteria bacterium]